MLGERLLQSLQEWRWFCASVEAYEGHTLCPGVSARLVSLELDNGDTLCALM